MKSLAAGVGIVVLVAIMILGIFMDWWPLSSVLLNVIPIFIAGGIIGLFVWGFKDRIDNWFNKNDIKISHSPPKKAVIPNVSIPEPKPIVPESRIKNGIRHYENRSQLPFNEMVYKTEEQLEMLAITFRIITYANYDVLRGLLSRKIQITFLLLNPNSSSLTILCNLKKEFKDLIEIKLYDSISRHSR